MNSTNQEKMLFSVQNLHRKHTLYPVTETTSVLSVNNNQEEQEESWTTFQVETPKKRASSLINSTGIMSEDHHQVEKTCLTSSSFLVLSPKSLLHLLILCFLPMSISSNKVYPSSIIINKQTPTRVLFPTGVSIPFFLVLHSLSYILCVSQTSILHQIVVLKIMIITRVSLFLVTFISLSS